MAFVLSGGGNLGALQVGMLRALLEHGVRPDLVIGCSVGAINGAGFADDPTLDHVDELERLWIALDGQNLLPSGWSNAVSLARRGEAIHDHEGLRRMAEEALRSRTFEDLELRFECVATDVAGAEEVWFDSGQLIDPILASSALPAIYPPVEIGGVRYLDGGIVNDVPMSRAVELGAATIYILQVGSFLRSRREPRRPLDVALQAYWVARHHRFKRELGALPPDVAVHVLPTGETPRMRFNDFTHSATLIARAHEATAGYLSEMAAGRPAGAAYLSGLAAVDRATGAAGDAGRPDTAVRDDPDRPATDGADRRTTGAPGDPGRRATGDAGRRATGAPGDAGGRGLQRVANRAGGDGAADPDEAGSDVQRVMAIRRSGGTSRAGDTQPNGGLRRRATTRRNGTDPDRPGDRTGTERGGTSDDRQPAVHGNGASRALRRVTRRTGNGSRPAPRGAGTTGEGTRAGSGGDGSRSTVASVARTAGKPSDGSTADDGDPREPNTARANGSGRSHGTVRGIRWVPARRNGQRRHPEPAAADEPDGGLYIPAGTGAEEPGDDGDPGDTEPVGVRRWAKATRLRRLGERVFDGGDRGEPAPGAGPPNDANPTTDAEPTNPAPPRDARPTHAGPPEGAGPIKNAGSIEDAHPTKGAGPPNGAGPTTGAEPTSAARPNHANPPNGAGPPKGRRSPPARPDRQTGRR